jgi:hypothetical protein
MKKERLSRIRELFSRIRELFFLILPLSSLDNED